MARRKRFPPVLEIEVERLTPDGLGLGWYQHNPDAQPVEAVAKAALPGERVTARLVRKRRRQLMLVTEAVARPHAERVSSACAYFPRCGGCTWHHVSCADQFQHKVAGILAAFAAAGVQVPSTVRRVASPEPIGYRRKARLGVRWHAVDGVCLVGFREAFGSRIARMDTCAVLTPALARLIQPLQSLIATMAVRERVPQVEVAAADSGTAVVVRHLEPLSVADTERLEEFAAAHDVWLYSQAGGPESVLPIASAPARLDYQNDEFGLQFEFHPLAFIQVNAGINRRLVSDVVAALGVTGESQVLDLFCGIGNFTLPLARAGARVVGVESAAAAVADARANARRNELAERTAFHVHDLYAAPLDVDVIDLASVESILLDPPRSGAGPQLASWLHPSVRRVGYVSCGPRSFIEDASTLTAAGFALETLTVLDMFPFTPHVELFGVFERR